MIADSTPTKPEPTIEVVKPGPFTSLQDLGRSGGRRYGIGPGGAFDRPAHRAANELVANPPTAASLEVTLQGLRLRFLAAHLIAVTGAEIELYLDGQPCPTWTAVLMESGQTLDFKRRVRGARAYLAVHGGFEAPLVLGSRSTYVGAALGGYDGLGRTLRAGDRLTVGPPTLSNLASATGKSWPSDQRPALSHSVSVRVTPGPFEDCFEPLAFERLYGQPYSVSPASDRMGTRLIGPEPLPRLSRAELLPYGAVWGNIQVPPDGQPIVLGADHQVTGGYPVIATVSQADLPLLAQLLPGDTVSFSADHPGEKL